MQCKVHSEWISESQYVIGEKITENYNNTTNSKDDGQLHIYAAGLPSMPNSLTLTECCQFALICFIYFNIFTKLWQQW